MHISVVLDPHSSRCCRLPCALTDHFRQLRQKAKHTRSTTPATHSLHRAMRLCTALNETGPLGPGLDVTHSVTKNDLERHTRRDTTSFFWRGLTCVQVNLGDIIAGRQSVQDGAELRVQHRGVKCFRKNGASLSLFASLSASFNRRRRSNVADRAGEDDRGHAGCQD